MAIIVRGADEHAIALPARLMAELNLREGDEVKPIVDGQTLRFARLDKFLALRGTLEHDEAFDQAMAFIEQAWASWTNADSV